MTVPSFRRASPPKLRPREAGPKREGFRGSARARGYDTQWQKVRDAYFAKHPFCEECGRLGYLKPASEVDHMEPLADSPKRRLDPTNLDSLCEHHHNGWKRRLERHARQTDQVHMLPEWVKQPQTRPPGFQIVRTGPVKEDGTVA